MNTQNVLGIPTPGTNQGRLVLVRNASTRLSHCSAVLMATG